jgi:hypothetical protein
MGFGSMHLFGQAAKLILDLARESNRQRSIAVAMSRSQSQQLRQ